MRLNLKAAMVMPVTGNRRSEADDVPDHRTKAASTKTVLKRKR